jgi:hypothetical protein
MRIFVRCTLLGPFELNHRLDFDRFDDHLVPGADVDSRLPTVRADEWERFDDGLEAAAPTGDADRSMLNSQDRSLSLGSRRNNAERKMQRRRNDLTEAADGHVDGHDAPAAGVADDLNKGRCHRELVHVSSPA